MQQVARDDVQLAQAVATEDGQDVGDQLPERRADAAHQQGDKRDQQQRGAADARQDRRNLLQACIANAQQLFDALAGGMSRGKQVFAAVFHQLDQQVETGKDDEQPDQFVGDKARQRHVAGEQGQQ